MEVGEEKERERERQKERQREKHPWWRGGFPRAQTCLADCAMGHSW
jgi:hypothetical protein